MSRDKKRELVWYQVDDTVAIAKHLEKMAAKGWLLEGIDNWWYRYRRAEPVQVKYTVTFFPDASVFDPGLTEGQETYADYCRAAGWELAAAYGPFQFFRSTRPDPSPVETDETVKLAAVRRTMRKSFVLTYAMLLLIPLAGLPALWSQLRWEPMHFFSSNGMLANFLLMAAIALFSGGFLLDYLVWVLRSRYSVDRGGACVKPHTRARLWASAGMLAVCAAAVAGQLIDQPVNGMGGVFLIFLTFYGGFVLLIRWILRRSKRRGSSRGSTRGIMIAFAVGAGLVMGFGTPILFSRLAGAGIIHMGREPVETYTKTYDNVSWSYTQGVFYDALPVTMEDLGYTVTPEDHCTYEAEAERSLLAVHREYTQDALSIGSSLPRLAYQTFESRWSWVREVCWERLLAESGPKQELGPSFLGALETYQEEDRGVYLLRYPESIVILELWHEATPQQMEAIVLALRA